MAESHLTGELLDALFHGEMPPEKVLVLLANHLLRLCPECGAGFEAWRRRRVEAGDYAPAFARLRRRLEDEAEQFTEEREQAERWLAELLPLPPEERLARIRRARTRYGGHAFVELLLAASRRCLPGRPAESFHLAEAAHEAVLRAGVGDEVAWALLALAKALMGNGRRALGDLAAADELLAMARNLVEGPAMADALDRAEIHALEGVLRKDQRRFSEAEALLRRAVRRYRSLGNEVRAAEVLIALGLVHEAAGDIEKAIEVALQSLALLEPKAEARLYLFARYNLAFYLHGAGRHEEAMAVLIADLERWEGCEDEALAVRLRWLQGKLAFALGEPGEAEEAFKEVRAYFLEGANPLDAAHAALDLALLYFQDGRLDEVKTLAAETADAFASQAVHQEALVALILFRQAAEAERVSEEMIRSLARYLERAKTDPAAAYQAPS
jgi:tetratricopeptide (TPR) repeat protein